MSTPDQMKYADVPSKQENVWGVGLKDAKRQGRGTACLDVGQSVTGLILGLFLFCHMAFTGSVNLGKDVFANMIETSGGAFFDGVEHMWMHVAFVGFIFLCVAIHAFCALRRFPTSYAQFRDIKAHYKLLKHEDTTLWIIQITTGFLLFFFVFTHVVPMLFNPHGFDVNLIGEHTYHMGMVYTFIFLVITELHGMIGLYRLAVKWDIFAKNPETNMIDQRMNQPDRKGLRKTMLFVALIMIVCGTITGYTNYTIGQDHPEGQRYTLQADQAWWH